MPGFNRLGFGGLGFRDFVFRVVGVWKVQVAAEFSFRCVEGMRLLLL